MKKIYIIMCFFSIHFFLQAKEIPDIVESPNDMKIIETISGNFISKTVKNNIYIIEDPRYITGYEKKKPLTIVYYIYGRYRYLPVHTLGYSDTYIKLIDNITSNFSNSEVKKNCIIGDFNNNGLDEIIFFELTGMSFEAKVIEFNDMDFTVILDTRPMEVVRQLQYKMENDCPTFMVSNGKIFMSYQWNEKENKYILIQ